MLSTDVKDNGHTVDSKHGVVDAEGKGSMFDIGSKHHFLDSGKNMEFLVHM